MYAAPRVPNDDDFAAIRVGMLTAATRLVDRLATHVPVRDVVNAGEVFADQNGDSRAECFLSKIGTMNLEHSQQEERHGQTTG